MCHSDSCMHFITAPSDVVDKLMCQQIHSLSDIIPVSYKEASTTHIQKWSVTEETVRGVKCPPEPITPEYVVLGHFTPEQPVPLGQVTSE